MKELNEAKADLEMGNLAYVRQIIESKENGLASYIRQWENCK